MCVDGTYEGLMAFPIWNYTVQPLIYELSPPVKWKLCKTSSSWALLCLQITKWSSTNICWMDRFIHPATPQFLQMRKMKPLPLRDSVFQRRHKYQMTTIQVHEPRGRQQTLNMSLENISHVLLSNIIYVLLYEHGHSHYVTHHWLCCA